MAGEARSVTLEQRFWPKVEKTDGCWLWRGAKLGVGGYGGIRRAGRYVFVHRIAWELHHGPIPAGQFVLHRCDNRRCVRPDHLFLGTHADNMADMATKGRAAGGPTTRVLDEDTIAKARRLQAEGWSLRRLGAHFGVSYMTLWDALRGHTWKRPVQDADAD